MTPGFDAAQARYDSMLPSDPVVFPCRFSGESSEDCCEDDHPEKGECEPPSECFYCGPRCGCDYEPDFDREDDWG